MLNFCTLFLSVCEDESQREIIATNRTLLEEHNRLQDLAYSLQGKHHKMSLEVSLYLVLFDFILFIFFKCYITFQKLGLVCVENKSESLFSKDTWKWLKH